MNDLQWNVFCEFKASFKEKVEQWNKKYPSLVEKIQMVNEQTKVPYYPVENPIVYNSDLDKITKEDTIKLIVIADNPGKDEQLDVNKRYLCGQAGKIAEGWFFKNKELNIDFRKNAIILNKTPVHSAKTKDLKMLCKNNPEIQIFLAETQRWMAEQTCNLHRQFCELALKNNESLCQLWLVGYSELKDKGFFTEYKNYFLEAYKNISSNNNVAWDNVFVFQHFSMNRFSIDLNDFIKKNDCKQLLKNLETLGNIHKKEIFC